MYGPWKICKTKVTVGVYRVNTREEILLFFEGGVVGRLFFV